MLQLNELAKLKKSRKRIGRGGERGGTSGKGHKGQKARTGSASELRPFFEGGQMPLSRRLPVRGFTNAFAKKVKIINIKDLEAKFSENEIVNKQTLVKMGLIKGKDNYLIKVLGKGVLSKPLTVQVNSISKSALKAIEKAGGNFSSQQRGE
ncbi:MAG: 50S ribosomal protein L15 [bacterium]